MASTLGVGRPGDGQRASPQPRQPSTPLYTLFSPAQIKAFREAFNLIDVDRSGSISAADLGSTLASVGLPAGEADVAAYLAQGEGDVTFTRFLTVMGDKLLRMDDERALEDAFGSFDKDDGGVVGVEELRVWLTTTGDRMTDDEVDALLSPTSRFTNPRTGTFDYRAFVRSLKVNGADDDDDDDADAGAEGEGEGAGAGEDGVGK